VDAKLHRLPPVEAASDATEVGYHLFICNNSIVRNDYRLREAGPVEFRPTYKLARKKKAPEYFWISGAVSIRIDFVWPTKRKTGSET